jgi:hypothetical protein
MNPAGRSGRSAIGPGTREGKEAGWKGNVFGRTLRHRPLQCRRTHAIDHGASLPSHEWLRHDRRPERSPRSRPNGGRREGRQSSRRRVEPHPCGRRAHRRAGLRPVRYRCGPKRTDRRGVARSVRADPGRRTARRDASTGTPLRRGRPRRLRPGSEGPTPARRAARSGPRGT